MNIVASLCWELKVYGIREVFKAHAVWACGQSVTNCYIYTYDMRHIYVRWRVGGRGVDHLVILHLVLLCFSTAGKMLCNTGASSSSPWRNLWCWTVYVCLAVAACSIPWWSPPGTHPQTQMCCRNLRNPRPTKTTSTSCPLSSQLRAAPPASPCSCGKMPAHPGTWAPPTGCWSLFLVCRSGNRSSTSCWPPPRSCRAASGSPAAAAGGQRARRDSSAPAPPSTLRPRCPPGGRALSQMP